MTKKIFFVHTPKRHMARFNPIFGFPVIVDYHYRLGDKKYQLRPGSVRALKLLASILKQAPIPHDVAWLLPFRGQIRKIQRINPRSALTLVVDRTNNEPLRLLAIWLRGRCGRGVGASTVSRFSNSPDKALRKVVARCLKRLSAWAELRAIATSDPDPQIRRLATQFPPKPYVTRLASYSAHIPRRNIATRKLPLVVSPELNVTLGRPPKPRWLIRIILQRIHRLITGLTR